ncbi:MAG: GGDEF domain-containing protein [Lachnospiraceae bacterium]|nr:GGDEF domain-containing protein [Lachnospiraceae bacterium]
MTDKEFILSVYFEDLIKVAKVNLFTGEYKFVKLIEHEKELGCLETKTINGYVDRIIENQLIHPDDVERYRFHLDLNNIRSKLFQYRREKMVYSFRRKMGEIYCWVTLEILIPKNFSQENPWIVFSWKDSDSDSRAMEDSLNILSMIFHKILKVNLTDDTYEEIKIYNEEMTEAYGFSIIFSEWLHTFAELGFVFKEDLEEYHKFTDLDYLKNHFLTSKDCVRCRYRRKINEKFRWVTLEILPGIEYTDEEQIVMLYIRDIHDSYIAELHYKKELEYYCNYDTLTGIWNRYYYDKCRSEYDRRQNKKRLAVIFADINGLKYVNDTYGHSKGDEYIQSFVRLLADSFGKNSCFRISGDEFLVICERIEKEEFLQKFEEFHAILQNQPQPMASIGWSWKDMPERLETLVSEAEQEMYMDKQEFYRRFPDLVR